MFCSNIIMFEFEKRQMHKFKKNMNLKMDECHEMSIFVFAGILRFFFRTEYIYENLRICWLCNWQRVIVRRNFFSTRVVNMWNSLPAETTDFSNLSKFNKSVSSVYLLKFCHVNFAWY